MTVSDPKTQVCLLKKTIQIPTGHGTGELVKGELVTVVSSQGDDWTISLLMDSSQLYSCHERNLKLVPYEIVKFLLPVIPCSKRYDAFIKLDKELLDLPLGCHVNVNRGRPNSSVIGELRYRGEIKDRLGVWFGLKLVGLGSGCGDSDGSVNGVYYIDRASSNSVIYATIDELTMSKGTDAPQDSTVSMLSNMGDIKDRSLNKNSKTLPSRSRRMEPKSNQCTYTEGDEVIVLKNKSPAEAGVVKAVFQDAKKRWMLGIELDNPVGDSDGIYKGRQMFRCHQKYGIFCEFSEAMPKHFYETPNKVASSQSSSPKLSNHSRSSSHGTAPPAFTSPPASFTSPPPPYGESLNCYTAQSQLYKPSNKSPLPNLGANKTPKADFEKAFRMRSPSPSSSGINNLITADLLQSMNTMSVVGISVEDSVESNNPRRSVDLNSSDVYKSRDVTSADIYKIKDTNTTDVHSRSASYDDADKNRVEMPVKVDSLQNRVDIPNKVEIPIDVFSKGDQSGNRHESRASPKHSPETPDPPPDIDSSLEIGSMVQVIKGSMFHYGVIRWIGSLPSKSHVCAGLELEEEISVPSSSNGSFDGVRYFNCPPFRAFFCYLHDCSKDSRFDELPVQEVKQFFGPHQSLVIEGRVDPPNHISSMFIGRSRGIQGNRNSCYLDATLYAMFAFNNTMDFLLSSPIEDETKRNIQQQLKESVVNPLREGGFVGAEHMGILRDLLSKSSSLEGLRDEEKEPEELLNVLFSEIFNIKPLLSFRDGTTNEISYVNLCQILLERDPLSASMPNTQDLLTRYFVSQNLFFHTQPDLLLLQVPRSGKDFKVYDTVLTSTELQLGGLCGGVWGSCFLCHNTPFMKCAQCYLGQEFKCKYSAVPFCESCCKLVHSHPDRKTHRPENATNPTRSIRMVLSAVLCIHTSHYVTYCRVPTQINGETASSHKTDSHCWVFFDSMADREGGVGGYNIPQVEECPELETWLKNPAKLLHDKDRAPDYVKRLVSDALLCFYVRDTAS